MAERNTYKELEAAKKKYNNLKFDYDAQKRKYDGYWKGELSRFAGYVQGAADRFGTDSKEYKKAVSDYNSVKADADAVMAELDSLKPGLDAAKKEMESAAAAVEAERKSAERERKAKRESESRQKKAESAKDEASRLREEAQVQRDLGNEEAANKLEADASKKDAEAAAAPKAGEKGVKPAGVSTPEEAAPLVPGAAPEVTSPEANKYLHNLKPTANQIIWLENGKWVAKNAGDFYQNGQVKQEYIPQIRKALADAGYKSAGSLAELTNNWRDLVLSTGGQYSPLEAKKWADEFLGGVGGTGTGTGTGGPRTTTSTRIQDPRSLQQTINQVWNNYLKRDATWQEIKGITDLVNKEIKNNPITTTVDAAGNVTTSGFDEGAIGAFIINQAKRRPEFKAQQGEDFESWIDENAGGIKFNVLVNDTGLDAVRRLYMAGNETDALRALKKLDTVAKAEASGIAGRVANAEQSLSSYARSMGVAFDVKSYAKSIADNMMSEDDVKNQIKELAKSYYPAWSKQLDTGQTMASIAYPYLNSMANVLELNPADVSIENPVIKKALSSRDKDGNPTSQSLWDFEYSLRQDPRWGYTKNARAEIDSVARSVLRDFGLAY